MKWPVWTTSLINWTELTSLTFTFTFTNISHCSHLVRTMRQPSSAPPRTPPFWLQRVGPRKFSNPQILFATVLFILSMLAWNIIILSDMSSADKPEQHPTGSVGDFRPLVAVMTPVASDSYPAPWNSTSLPLFTKMLPSLIENLNCEFRYVVMIGYRKGDAYYDSPEVINSTK